MFFALNEFGSERLRLAFDTLPIDRAHKLRKTAAFLDVSERTLSSWLTGKTCPPRAAVYAIWHESPNGREATAAHSEQAAHLWRTLSKSQTTYIDRLKADIDKITNELNELKQHHASAAPIAANESRYSRY